MARKKVVMSLFNLDSIDKAIGEIETFKNETDTKIDRFFRRLAEEGVEIAQSRIVDYEAIFTGELFKSLHIEQRANRHYAIVCDSEHAAFVEFGTGQMGEENPYPYPLPNGLEWTYNNYDKPGSKIFEIKDGQYGWFYPALDGSWKFTQGMPARPFMQETEIELENRVRKIAREIFDAN